MSENHLYSEKLFSYGTLQYEPVQFSTFGRKLNGTPDVLFGYRLSQVRIDDPAVVAISGEAVHSILTYTGSIEDQVKGTVFDISLHELRAADEYEVDAYKRTSVKLHSGTVAWVYVGVDSNKDLLLTSLIEEE